MAKNEDPVKKIFGMSAKEVLSPSPHRSIWKDFKVQDGNTLFAHINVSSLEEAGNKAKLFTDKLKDFSKQTNKLTHLSLSSESLSIILYGKSKKVITDQDWEMARELTEALQLEKQ